MTKHVDDELLPPTPAETDYLRRQRHPYAKLSVTVPDAGQESVVSTALKQRAVKNTVSQEIFELESRRILGLYIPGVEKGRLRPHYVAFISRNKSRSPSTRYKILQKLRKYDLSDISGFEGRFNREREELTEAKLREIEQSVGDDE